MSENKRLVPISIIYLDGVRLSPACEGAFRSIRIIDRLNGISHCTIVYDYSDLKPEDTNLFPFDTRISVDLGYKDDAREVFNGEITGIHITLPEYGPSLFKVTASSCLGRLEHGQHTRVFENKTPSEAIKDILALYNLQADSDSFGAQKAYWEGREQTDLDLVLDLARRGGKDIYAFGDKVFVKTEMTMSKDEIIYEWGKSLISFRPELDIKSQVSGIRTLGWNTEKKEGFSGEIKTDGVEQKVGGGKDWTKVSRSGDGQWVDNRYAFDVHDQSEAEESARALMREKSFKLLRAEGSGEGNAKLSAGMPVTIKYVGKAFSGEYIAEQVHHEFSLETGYITNFILKRNMLDNEFQKGVTSVTTQNNSQATSKKENSFQVGQDISDDEEKITDTMQTEVEKYRVVHRNFIRHVYTESGIEIKREAGKIIDQSELFDRKNDAENFAVRAASPYSKGQNRKRTENYIETWDIVNHNLYDEQRKIYYDILDVNRWNIVIVRVKE